LSVVGTTFAEPVVAHARLSACPSAASSPLWTAPGRYRTATKRSGSVNIIAAAESVLSGIAGLAHENYSEPPSGKLRVLFSEHLDPTRNPENIFM
jgi:hypothetical protein